MPKTHNLFVSSDKVSSSLAAGSVVAVCPRTGSVNSSLRVSGDLSGKVAVGVSTLSPFPKNYTKKDTRLAMCFGSTQKKDDTYAMLVLLRASAFSPILHWKSRLPEPNFTAGLSISPCGTYIIGGASSGNLYVWTAIGGNLLKTVKAHFKAVRVLRWTSCGKYLITGGADGMIHMYSLLSLVSNDGKAVQAMRTWSCHQLEITSLVVLEGDQRIASASLDGDVTILEISSEEVLATIQFNQPIKSLTYHDHCLFAGASSGSVHLIDLDEYAIHRTEKMDGVKIARSNLDRVFGKEETPKYLMELRGHSHPVLSLCAWTADDGSSFLCSGDASGELRIWDLASRNCMKEVRPWSQSVTETTNHPVTSITLVELFEEEKGLFDNTRKDGKTLASLVSPLQKFLATDLDQRPVPFLRASKSNDDPFWDVTSSENWAYYDEALRERKRRADGGEVDRLRRELAATKAKLSKLQES